MKKRSVILEYSMKTLLFFTLTFSLSGCFDGKESGYLIAYKITNSTSENIDELSLEFKPSLEKQSIGGIRSGGSRENAGIALDMKPVSVDITLYFENESVEVNTVVLGDADENELGNVFYRLDIKTAKNIVQTN